jgi:hypothetical protein
MIPEETLDKCQVTSGELFLNINCPATVDGKTLVLL